MQNQSLSISSSACNSKIKQDSSQEFMLQYSFGVISLPVAEIYKAIPHELSGSMSKNRFRQEILWGIGKMFDLLDETDMNFCVVFDYKCDIEVHFCDAIELYQVKSHKVQSPYTFSQLSKKDGKNSIIAKLFLLKDVSCEQVRIRCMLVSNAFLKVGKRVFSESVHLSFADFDEKTQSIIRKALCMELSRSDVDLSGLHFIYTSMDLASPEDAVRGKITGSFEKIKGCEPVKPNALYRLILDTVQERACYEFTADDYDELVKRKGITKLQLNMMLDTYMDKTDNSVEQVRLYIEQTEQSLKKRKELKIALVKVVEAECKSLLLKNIENDIVTYISKHNDMDGFPSAIIELADNLLHSYEDHFPIEYSRAEKYVFILLIIKRWEDGKYE